MPETDSTIRGLSPARLRVLRAVAQHQTGPVTLADLVDRLGGHPSATRQLLDALAAASLVQTTTVARGTTGRRPMGYTVTSSGWRSLAAADADGHREIVRATAAYHDASGGASEDAYGIGELWGRQSASSLPEDATRDSWQGLVEVLDVHGFAPEASPAADRIVLRHCPLLETAREFPGFICTVHAGMVHGVLGHLRDPRRMDLIPFAEPHGCVLQDAPAIPA